MKAQYAMTVDASAALIAAGVPLSARSGATPENRSQTDSWSPGTGIQRTAMLAKTTEAAAIPAARRESGGVSSAHRKTVSTKPRSFPDERPSFRSLEMPAAVFSMQSVTSKTEEYCQSACKFDPSSASNFDPFVRRVLLVALVSSELAGIAEARRARVA